MSINRYENNIFGIFQNNEDSNHSKDYFQKTATFNTIESSKIERKQGSCNAYIISDYIPKVVNSNNNNNNSNNNNNNNKSSNINTKQGKVILKKIKSKNEQNQPNNIPIETKPMKLENMNKPHDESDDICFWNKVNKVIKHGGIPTGKKSEFTDYLNSPEEKQMTRNLIQNALSIDNDNNNNDSSNKVSACIVKNLKDEYMEKMILNSPIDDKGDVEKKKAFMIKSKTKVVKIKINNIKALSPIPPNNDNFNIKSTPRKEQSCPNSAKNSAFVKIKGLSNLNGMDNTPKRFTFDTNEIDEYLQTEETIENYSRNNDQNSKISEVKSIGKLDLDPNPKEKPTTSTNIIFSFDTNETRYSFPKRKTSDEIIDTNSNTETTCTPSSLIQKKHEKINVKIKGSHLELSPDEKVIDMNYGQMDPTTIFSDEDRGTSNKKLNDFCQLNSDSINQIFESKSISPIIHIHHNNNTNHHHQLIRLPMLNLDKRIKSYENKGEISSNSGNKKNSSKYILSSSKFKMEEILINRLFRSSEK